MRPQWNCPHGYVGALTCEHDTCREIKRFARVEALNEAARLCDTVVRQPINRKKDDPRAVYQSGAARCAWVLRQKAIEVEK
jgi:hypothetical protein